MNAHAMLQVNPLILQDPIITHVVFHVFEIQKVSDHKKWDDLNAMLQMVCKKFNKVVFTYNHTPRYALAANYNTVSDIVAKFKDSHLAKMLRELGLMQYWDRFKKQNMYIVSKNLKYLETSWGVRDAAHRTLIVHYITREVAAHGGR